MGGVLEFGVEEGPMQRWKYVLLYVRAGLSFGAISSITSQSAGMVRPPSQVFVHESVF